MSNFTRAGVPCPVTRRGDPGRGGKTPRRRGHMERSRWSDVVVVDLAAFRSAHPKSVGDRRWPRRAHSSARLCRARRRGASARHARPSGAGLARTGAAGRTIEAYPRAFLMRVMSLVRTFPGPTSSNSVVPLVEQAHHRIEPAHRAADLTRQCLPNSIGRIGPGGDVGDDRNRAARGNAKSTRNAANASIGSRM